jgi:hypothetical protein
MRESILNKIQICEHCRKAYIPNIEGDAKTCDECLDDPFIPEEPYLEYDKESDD